MEFLEKNAMGTMRMINEYAKQYGEIIYYQQVQNLIKYGKLERVNIYGAFNKAFSGKVVKIRHNKT